MDDVDDPLHDYKLCGFFLAILTTPSPPPSLSPGTPASPSDLTFVTSAGVPLLPLTPVALDGRRKRRRKEVSRSAVIQVLELARKGHLRVRGEVVGVVGDGYGIGRVRVVVLVDVFLPMAAWDEDGWQFPSKADGVLAAPLFEHVSCDWKKRNSIRACHAGNKNYIHEKDEDLWYDSDCHVLGCRMHSDVHSSSKKGLFNLHELFQGLPTAVRVETRIPTKIKPKGTTTSSGIWNVSDDVLTNVLSMLSPRDLVSVAATCHHLRSLALSIVPCAKLKLYPHQRAAIEWMLKRERKPSVFPHPLVMEFSTEDGFNYFINAVSGKITTKMAPTITDFRGGMFCDEPGLGKTITALSLILKTHGTLAEPPHGANVVWCMHHHVQRCGYYEVRYNSLINGNPSPISKRTMSQNIRRGQNSPGICSSEQNKSEIPKSSASNRSFGSHAESFGSTEQLHTNSKSLSRARVTRRNRKLNDVKKNLMYTFDKDSALVKNAKAQTDSTGMNRTSESVLLGRYKRDERSQMGSKEHRHKFSPDSSGSDETWVQCDACGKWRKLFENSVTDAKAAWFCSMNDDHLHQSCAAPQENWDRKDMILDLPGFCTKGSSTGKERNISFFLNILKEHFALINSETMKALIFLAELSCDRLLEMERNGLTLPNRTLLDILGHEVGYEKIFQAFGLVRKLGRQEVKWCYPRNLENLEFDALALEIALTKPLDMFRLYLSRATLIVVPANLVEHWKIQINKLAIPGQLRVFVWTDQMKPAVHNLAWDYDIVITTFSRLSAEWNPRNRSVLMHVHWLRIILDEGHTLGSSICLTNKLQMAISLVASNRWILTGTPTPNTPKSQLSNLQPMLKFLCEEVYGRDQESWDSGILKPFHAEIEEGSFRLLKLLERIMISSRKKDLKTIPPCIKKISFLHFNEEHAKSYNELVLTIRRNILLADWNDPSHIESLLNPKQWKFRSNTIRNVRLSCCVAGHIKMAGAGHDIQETMDDLVRQGLDPLSDEHEHIRSSLLRGCMCSRCEEWCRLPVITPCRHLLCLDCVVLDSERCTFPRCGRPYEMQLPESLARPENPNPKWSVPKDLIELQPSYRQDEWDPDWNSTSSSKVSYLVERLLNLKEANRTMGFCENENNWNTSSEKCNIKSLRVDACERLCDSSSMSKPEKAIIFSQFLEHIHVIEQQLEISGMKYGKLYSPTHFSDKMKSLVSFQQDAGCVALIMDGSAALGLDLSFVTHVFLMEPIWDKSIEEQVISRAHRMGATRPIHVETLAMRGTIEEQMLDFLQDASEGRKRLKQDINKTDASEGRVQRTLHDFAESSYLAHLGFVKTNNTNR